MKHYGIFLNIFSLFFITSASLNAETTVTQNTYSAGSGFVISKQGHIATNAHVIQNCDKNRIFLLKETPDNLKINLKHIAIDTKNDLAILQAPSHDYKNIAFSNSPETIKKQDTVYIVGYPHTQSSLDFKKTSFEQYQEHFDTDNNSKKVSMLFANVARHGNSGGPLLDKAGNLVGIVQGMASVTQSDNPMQEKHLSIAIPTNHLQSLMNQNGISFEKQNSNITKDHTSIHNHAKGYMVRVICN